MKREIITGIKPNLGITALIERRKDGTVLAHDPRLHAVPRWRLLTFRLRLVFRKLVLSPVRLLAAVALLALAGLLNLIVDFALAVHDLLSTIIRLAHRSAAALLSVERGLRGRPTPVAHPDERPDCDSGGNGVPEA